MSDPKADPDDHWIVNPGITYPFAQRNVGEVHGRACGDSKFCAGERNVNRLIDVTRVATLRYLQKGELTFPPIRQGKVGPRAAVPDVIVKDYDRIVTLRAAAPTMVMRGVPE
jgi:hypothetical protein